MPWWGFTASATIQSRPGPVILANYTVTSALVQGLGRNLGTGSATTQLIAPFTMFGDRLTQVDLRFGKIFKIQQRARIQASVDLYNLFNSSAILTQNNTVGALWRSPTNILQGRLAKIGAQVDF